MNPAKPNPVKATIKPEVLSNITLHLTETEARALDALAGYGIKPFLEVFYKHMGRAYLEPHEAGLVSVFETIRALGPVLGTIEELRRKMPSGSMLRR